MKKVYPLNLSSSVKKNVASKFIGPVKKAWELSMSGPVKNLEKVLPLSL